MLNAENRPYIWRITERVLKNGSNGDTIFQWYIVLLEKHLNRFRSWFSRKFPNS